MSINLTPVKHVLPIADVLAARKMGRPRLGTRTQAVVTASTDGLATLVPTAELSHVFQQTRRLGLKMHQSKYAAPEGYRYVWVGGPK